MLRAVRDAGTRGSLPLALVFALAFAAYFLADAIAQVVVLILDQHVNRERGTEFGSLSFHIGETRIDYSNVLQHGLAVAVLAAGLYALWRLTGDSLRVCPDCRSEVPRDANVCRYCTSDIGSESDT